MNLKGEFFIVDMGSSFTRIGFGGQKQPKYTLPSYVGIPPRNEMQEEGSLEKGIIGDNLKASLPDVEVKHIYDNGKVLDYDAFEILLDSILPFQLSFKPEQATLILSEDHLAKREQREKLCNIAFQKFNFRSIMFNKSSTLQAFSCGRSTGIVLESGNSFTTATIVHDGYSFWTSCKRNQVAGKALTNQIKNYIEQELKIDIVPEVALKDTNITPSYYEYSKLALCNQIKESVYGGSENIKEFTLPDKQVIKINKQNLPDIFSKTNNSSIHYRGIPSMISEVINHSELEFKSRLYQNIILTGGNTFVHGFTSHIQNQVNKVAPIEVKPFILSTPRRKDASFLGASIMSSISNIQPFCISKYDYKELGITILSKKCP